MARTLHSPLRHTLQQNEACTSFVETLPVETCGNWIQRIDCHGCVHYPLDPASDPSLQLVANTDSVPLIILKFLPLCVDWSRSVHHPNAFWHSQRRSRWVGHIPVNNTAHGVIFEEASTSYGRSISYYLNLGRGDGQVVFKSRQSQRCRKSGL
jgi:hypothetical protein